jgi:hypothetical protein
MVSAGMCATLKIYARENFSEAKYDLFSMFLVRAFLYGKPASMLSMVTMQAWMFISSFEGYRKNIISHKTITSLAHIGFNSFPDLNSKFALAAATVLVNEAIPGYVGVYDDLNNNKPTSYDKHQAFLERNSKTIFYCQQDEFTGIPGAPIAYWISPQLRSLFKNNKKLSDFAITRKGMVTADNSKYVRYWHEVSINKIGLGYSNRTDALESRKKWFPYNKGGGFRRWYGNRIDVVNWENDGIILQTARHPTEDRVWATNFNLDYIFKPNVNWGAVCLDFSARYSEGGDLFDAGGSAAFTFDIDNHYLLSFLNSKVTSSLLAALNPTLNFQAGNIADLPIIISEMDTVRELAKTAVFIAKNDWNSYETSYGFETLAIGTLRQQANSLKSTWSEWEKTRLEAREQLRTHESLLNDVFINAYGLQAELNSEVAMNQVTLDDPKCDVDCQRILSYSLGCTLGRYSLDAPGLIYAHAGNVGFDQEKYKTFPADADGILPITEDRWFEEDAGSRVVEFVRTVWGAETLEENLAWLAESLGRKASESAEEAIRRYLADKFFKDHLQTYKKRPIYWLFSSGKQGAFQALVYLHRYHEGTLARLRAEYVLPLTGKMHARIDTLQADIRAASSTAARTRLTKQLESLRKQLKELLDYDEKLRHYADQRITLDLDDGVKVNYGKFGDLLAEVKAVTGGAAED